MIQQRITYLQRSTETDEYGQRRCQHLHAETEKLNALPTFAELRDRFGRCEGKVYVDTADGSVHCGYVFAKRERWYDRAIDWDDPKQFYTAETWVSFDNVSVAPIDLAKS